MPPFEESGLRITLPEDGSFRFAECRAYRSLSGRGVSEMDVGWWDGDRQTIHLLEVKDYSEHEPRHDLLSKLVAKGRDCLVMLHSAWGELGDPARDLAAELPERCRTPQKLKLFFVLKVGPAGLTREALAPLKDSLENHIRAYADLLGIRWVRVLLLDHHKAIEKGLPGARIELPAPPDASG